MAYGHQLMTTRPFPPATFAVPRQIDFRALDQPLTEVAKKGAKTKNKKGSL
jgi:hypothetical protein